MNYIEFIKNLLVVVTLGSNILLLGMLVAWTGGACSRKLAKYWEQIYKLILNYGLYFGLIVSLVATLGSLFYSEIAHYSPCKLCWEQRVLMYPQTLLFLLAILKKKTQIAYGAMWMSLVGVFMALYHYSLQVAPVKSDTCLSVGYSVSCSDNFAMNLGYITIPWMAFSAFLLLFVVGVIIQNKD